MLAAQERHRTQPAAWRPRLLLKQAALVALYAWLTRWEAGPFLRWLASLSNLRHAGAGAGEIGCFGPSPHLVWEATSRCNLRCVHCHVSGGERLIPELSTAEARGLIAQVGGAGISTFVFAGGEPLLRPDLFELIDYARACRLNLFLATNGTLITPAVARRLKEKNVGVVIGIDAMDAEIHDRIRGVPGALAAVRRGIENSARAGLYFHLNILATRINLAEVARVIDYGNALGAYSYFIYRFVPLGRGAAIRSWELDGAGTQALMRLVLAKQRASRAIIIPVAFPEYWPYAARQRHIKNRRLIRLLGRCFGGCQAGRGMTYLKPDGEAWACPFLPVKVASLKETPLREVCRLLAQRRAGLALPGCQPCPLGALCGGCKARAGCAFEAEAGP